MTCINPIAPADEIARTSPALSARSTARIQCSGMPKRCDASEMCAAKGWAAAGRSTGTDCATATPDPMQTESAPASSRMAQCHAGLSPFRRQPASVLAAVKGKAQAPADGRP
ncbi:hypothetical protein [Brevundimonas denitrificans]|uniref:hypothetical protein n=1 Tax=Brevundimonas denitrificans TaxID=1443434 RepID=UPI00223C08E2|nr:hypothetical protein [Brevundimonas denitrificans]